MVEDLYFYNIKTKLYLENNSGAEIIKKHEVTLLDYTLFPYENQMEPDDDAIKQMV